MRISLLNKKNLFKSLRQALVLFTMLLLPSAAWGETVTKTITFNKYDVQNHSVSVTEKIGSREPVSYVGKVNIWDSDGQLNGYTFSSDGAEFTLKNEAVVSKFFIIEIPGTYPAVPSQVTLKVAYANSGSNTETQNAEIRVGDYGNALTGNAATDPVAQNYTENHPYKSNSTSLAETTLTYIGNNQSGLGTNRDEAKSQYIYVYLNGNPSGGANNKATFTIKEVTMTYDTDVYDLSVAGIPVTGVNKDDVLGDGKVSFTPAENSDPATLTLNGANIEYASGNVIVSTLTTPLEVILLGNSNINSGSYLPFEGATGDNANLVFKTLGGDPASLVMTSSGISPTSFYTGFNKVLYPKDDGNQLYAYLSGDNVVIERATSYGLTVAGTPVTSANKDDILENGNEEVKFNPEGNTLTLKDATINGSIEWDNASNALTIAIEGKNSIVTEVSTPAFKSNAVCSLYINRKDPNKSATLKYSGSIVEFNLVSSLNFAQNSNVPCSFYTTETVYGLKIAGTDVHNITDEPGYKDDIFGDKKVSFEPANGGTPATLTLNNASITGNITFNSDLTVHLVGDNTITNPENASNSYAFNLGSIYNTLDFSTDETKPGTLKFVGLEIISTSTSGTIPAGTYGTSGDVRWKQTFSTDATPSYFILSLNKHYNLWKNGVQYHDLILDNNDGFIFDPEESTLLISSNSTDYINSGLENLTIIVSGSTSISYIAFGAPANTQAEGITTGTLTITGNKNSEGSNSIVLSNTDGGVISGFSSVTIEEPMGVKEPSPFTTWGENKAVISDIVSYDLWVEGIQVTSANKDNVKSESLNSGDTPSVIFDELHSILTFTDANITVTSENESLSAVLSGLENLTVKFDGSVYASKGTGVSSFYGFKAQEGKTCNITFEASGSFSFMVQTEPEYAVSGFSKVTYKDNLGAITDDNGYFHIWEELSLSFETALDDNYNPIGVKIVSSGEIVSHKIVYAIDYAKDDLEDIPETEYTDVIPLATITAGPCIYTAYTLSLDGENTKSNNLKYYYFQYSDSEVIIGNGTTIDLKDYLLPTLTGEDEVDLYNSSEQSGSIISINSENNTLTGIAYGTAIVSSSPEGVSTLTFDSGYELSIKVTVQDIIDESTFASGQSYGTFFNTTEAYNVPEGLQAYIITNVDEEKGTIEMTQTSVLPPNTPVLLYRTSTTGTPNYVFTKASNVEPATTMLKYTTTEKSADESSKLYVLYNGQFVKVTAGTKILANHCYLDLGGTSAGTRGFYNIGDGEGTTAIREVKSGEVKGEKWADGEWFDLQGRRLNAKPNKSGLYILNGRKVVIK